MGSPRRIAAVLAVACAFAASLPARGGPTSPDLELVKVAETAELQVGTPASYRLGITNVGTEPSLLPLVVTDIVPAGLTYAGHAGIGWTCLPPSPPGTEVVCTNPATLAAGASAPTLQLTFDVAPSAVPAVTNSASVDAAFKEGNLENNAVRVTTPVREAPPGGGGGGNVTINIWDPYRAPKRDCFDGAGFAFGRDATRAVDSVRGTCAYAGELPKGAATKMSIDAKVHTWAFGPFAFRYATGDLYVDDPGANDAWFAHAELGRPWHFVAFGPVWVAEDGGKVTMTGYGFAFLRSGWPKGWGMWSVTGPA